MRARPGCTKPEIAASNPAIDMPSSVIVWDIETVPDLSGFAAANALMGRSDDEVRAEMGEK